MSLWRTQRSQFPQYTPNGLGRDYYITYNNAGLWENIRPIQRAPDYERLKYNNFHTLFHRTAPVKYFADGHGRENYILQSKGMLNDEKPMCSYQLTDFLRSNNPRASNLKQYKSRDERKYNAQLRSLEKDLIKRLYPKPKKNNVKISQDEENYKTFNENFDENLKTEENNDFENNKFGTVKNKSNTVSTFPTITNKKINKRVGIKNKKYNSCFFDSIDYILKQSQTVENYEFGKLKTKKNNGNKYNIKNLSVSQRIFNQLRDIESNKKSKKGVKYGYYAGSERTEDGKKKYGGKNLFRERYVRDKIEM